MKFLAWIHLCLILVPFGIAGFSVYWITIVSEPILMAACGSDRISIGVLVGVAGLCSSLCAFLGSKNLANLETKSFLVKGYFISTALGFVLCFVALISTSTESQKMCKSRITIYQASHDNSETQEYLRNYETEYERLVFQFSYGQTAYEGYFILSCAWFVTVVGYFAMVEFYSSEHDRERT
jgi:hypothetical protein